MHDHESDTDDLDFGMLTPPTRPGPCKAAVAPEVDPVEKRLEREQETAEHIAEAVGLVSETHLTETTLFREPRRRETLVHEGGVDRPWRTWVEVKHGSGKVKV